jgi:glyoxylase-like metal-dependent hydrolase (beta-lactamase superfamily II)
MLVHVGKGVHRISGGVTNLYLVEESGKYTLVDAGTPRDWAVLGSSLAELGAKPEDLDAVLLTHAHVDHVGFAVRARTDTGAQVWIHPGGRRGGADRHG